MKYNQVKNFVNGDFTTVVSKRLLPVISPLDGTFLTELPCSSHQLKRLARHIAPGVGKVGGIGENGSGDIFIAFSTANAGAFNRQSVVSVKQFPNDQMNPLFEATVQTVEEAIINATVTADTTEGVNGNKAYELPHDKVIALLRKYGGIK